MVYRKREKSREAERSDAAKIFSILSKRYLSLASCIMCITRACTRIRAKGDVRNRAFLRASEGQSTVIFTHRPCNSAGFIISWR